MLIPRFWSRADSRAVTPDGKTIQLRVWRGSRRSAEEARALADEAVERMAGRIRRGEGFPERYAYGDRPLREEVVLEVPADAGGDEPGAAVTRNSYGALVLNAARAFFIDVDVPPVDGPRAAASPAASLWSLADSLPLPAAVRGILDTFRPRPAAAPAAPADPAAAALDGLRRWVAARPDWRVRVYRTHSGLRYLVTHAPFSPTDGEARAAMTALGADPQYVRLCQAQKSFRARLTPKPWRLGLSTPPARFPYESAADEHAMRAWEASYARASAGYAACRLIEELGSGTEHPEVAPLRALHDEQTRASSGLPLA